MDISNKSLLKDKCYIDGEWVNSNSKETINVNNPSNLKIIAKVPKSGKALMKLNTFATGRFPIKMHLSAEDHQGNAQHERTLLYLEVHPN